MTKRVAIYARVSTADQNAENQIQQLRQVAQKSNWKVVSEFVDQGISGAKGRDARPEFDNLLKGAIRRDYEIVMAWSVDRLGRSLQHLVAFLNEIQAVSCDLYLHQQGLDTTTPSGKMMFQMCGVFAEFERSIIQERVKAGLERAKANGVKLGRPRLPNSTKRQIYKMRDQGISMGNIADRLKVSKGVVHKVIHSPN